METYYASMLSITVTTYIVIILKKMLGFLILNLSENLPFLKTKMNE
jgi:hypothetical protein